MHIAHYIRINMEKKKLTKQDITASDAVYIIFTVVIAFCFVACAHAGCVQA